RLIETDRNWHVQVSVRLDLDRHKLVSRHLSHCPEDSLVERSVANLGGHVVGYRSNCRNHVSSLFLEIVRVHETPHSSDTSRRNRSVIRRRTLQALGDSTTHTADPRRRATVRFTLETDINVR